MRQVVRVINRRGFIGAAVASVAAMLVPVVQQRVLLPEGAYLTDLVYHGRPVYGSLVNVKLDEPRIRNGCTEVKWLHYFEADGKMIPWREVEKHVRLRGTQSQKV